MSTASAVAASTPEEMGEKDQPTFGMLEEDDEFEDFSAEDWAEGEEQRLDLVQWEDNWDDDAVDDDFANQLRAEVQRVSAAAPAKAPAH